MLGQRRTQYRRPDTKIIDDGRASGSAPRRVSICNPIRWRDAMTALFHGAVTRRKFLGTSAAALAASATPSAAPAQGARFRRFEISDPGMPPRVLDSYKKGIREMLNRPPTDPRNWYRNAFIHVFDCPHQNWWFLAWHRAYIGWLEATIREFSGDAQFALPYWDWTKTPRVPAAMFDDVLDPNNAAFIPTFDAFKAQFDAPVTALFAAFSQAQQDVLAQRGLSSTADFWSAVAAAPAGMFFEQPAARGLTPASPDLDRTTKATVALPTIRSALRTANFAGSADGTDPAGFASAKAASHNDQSREGKAGGITIFSHHVHGPTTFTVPLPEDLVVPAAAAGASVPLDIRVVPLEPPGVAPSPRVRATATSPQVATITVRTS